MYFAPAANKKEVMGTISTLWPVTQILYKGQAVTASTKFDFTAPVTLTLSHRIFGKDVEETIELIAVDDLSNACELLTVTINGKQDTPANPGVENAVKVHVAQRNVQVKLPRKPATPERLFVRFTQSEGATVLVDGKPFDEKKPIDLRQAVELTVLAANGRDSKSYTLSLSVEQAIIWSLSQLEYAYGDSPISLYCRSNAGLPVNITSTNGNVASVQGDKLHIGLPGQTTLSAAGWRRNL